MENSIHKWGKSVLATGIFIAFLGTILALPACQSEQGITAFMGSHKDTNDWYIVSMNEDGSGQVELTRWPSVGNHRQCWSRDGTLAYIEWTEGEPLAWLNVVDLDCNHRSRVLDLSGVNVESISISPDGKTVLLACVAIPKINRPPDVKPNAMISNHWDLYVVDVVTGTLNQLTDTTDIREINAVFSPDGRKIAFFGKTGDPQTYYDIYVIDSDGKNQRRLTNNDGSMILHDRSLQWSPDSKKILFSMDNVFIDDTTHYGDIFVTDVAKGSLANLTSSPDADDAEACWAPNGKKIAFTSGRSTDYGIWIMDADGRNAVKVQDSITQPSWLPDSKRIIAVHRVSERVYAVVTIDTEGKNMKTLIEGGDKYSATYYPIWLSQ